jgi:hypothetical protein
VGVIASDLHPAGNRNAEKEPTSRLRIICRAEPVDDAPVCLHIRKNLGTGGGGAGTGAVST